MNKFKESLRVNVTKEEKSEQTVGSQLTEFLCGHPNDPKVTKLVEKMLNKEDIEK